MTTVLYQKFKYEQRLHFVVFVLLYFIFFLCNDHLTVDSPVFPHISGTHQLHSRFNLALPILKFDPVRLKTFLSLKIV